MPPAKVKVLERKEKREGGKEKEKENPEKEYKNRKILKQQLSITYRDVTPSHLRTNILFVRKKLK